MFLFQQKWKKKLPKSLLPINRLKILCGKLRTAYIILLHSRTTKIGVKRGLKQILRINGIIFLVLILIYFFIKELLKSVIKTLVEIEARI
jgi:hypothetical protein